MINKLGHECQIKCPADKFYVMFGDNILDVPKAMPGSFKSVKVIKGDGNTVGSVRLWTYVLDDGGSLVKWVLEFEKKYDHSPHPHTHLDLFALGSSHFDALLHKPAKIIHKEEYESQIKCPVDKFFAMFKNDILDLPNTMPRSYKSVKVLEGDGKSVGSIRLWTYVLGDDPNNVLTAKEQLEELDDENRRITYRILEADVMVDYKSFVVKLSITPTSDGRSLVKWVVEFEKKHNQSPLPHTHLDLWALVSNHFDALLQKPATTE